MRLNHFYFYGNTTLSLNGAKHIIKGLLYKKHVHGGYSYLVDFRLFAFSFCVMR